MKFLVLPHLSSERKPPTVRLAEQVDNAVLAERLGFDGYGIGERHERPFEESAPPVILANIAARTSTIRLFTTVATLSLLDPVRAFEDYSTLDHLSGGRLELIIGKGNGPKSAAMFGVTKDDQRERHRENYELFRRLWQEDSVTWQGRHRPPLTGAEVRPRPMRPLRIWHGSATSKESVELAARHGDPLFSSNGGGPIEPYAELIRHYREQWALHGHDPADALVGAGTAGYYGHRDSRTAIERYRPIFEERLAVNNRYGHYLTFTSLEDFVERSSALVGSPQQIIEKVHRYHERFGHEVLHIHVDGDLLSPREYLETLELFQSEIAPVLRKELPSRPLADPSIPPWPETFFSSLTRGSRA
ncbi:alkanesulfonate monooxygenase SsuD/methylene tetrahydromethanopterin reductase-like flavin-dependent oxidoreductase (luciferase family) [Thermocatellispora tengchongensis]|uniref:Alkanesulfonate monooxygenase SsuD/methylene tetrahydromethanopterin reductase-like flavin-dependent oxidoreductase (Luciferase family) n=1 Tax=Thermocatellispora tengchongensis TaxID=1073253 RepID=A0A840PHI0_9ACTN|nr:LLM class flavin-dependent oxidoreductase [Thermocatellispora tengchongensis]MBB5135495.1 alkanesulfonate monooxygenase SsuD/methylene tetrahydromethanopterin reductase-like flavin-dependent oxidoreductase (luciferase family) [Thermocatellispora tengchongensis]